MTTAHSHASSPARRFLSLLNNVALAVGDALRADVKEEETVEGSVDLAADGEVIVVAVNGSIQVETWEGNEVRVVARKGARGHDVAEAHQLLAETEVQMEERGDSVRISAEIPKSRGLEGNLVTVAFKVQMPSDARLYARSKNGSIDVRGLDGRVRLETKNGWLTAQDLGGPLEAEARNGTIKALGVNGSVRARTTNGAIRVAINGPVLDDGVRLETKTGSIGLRLDAGVAASLSARTRHGSVTAQAQGQPPKKRRRSLTFDFNGGGPWIDLEGSTASIRVEERPSKAS